MKEGTHVRIELSAECEADGTAYTLSTDLGLPDGRHFSVSARPRAWLGMVVDKALKEFERAGGRQR